MSYRGLERAKRRDKKQKKAKNGMRVTNRGIFTIVETQVKKGKKSEEKND